ncbi:MAG: hypothetical protein ACTSRS_14045 [Candidatus Helarchaeota archaeon]
MTRWTVRLEGVELGDEDDLIFNFQDVKEITEPPNIERYILEDLLNMVESEEHYYKLPNVKSVESEEKDRIPHKKAAVILMTLKDTQERIGILMVLKDEFHFQIHGLRPDEFAEQVRQNPRKLMELLESLTKAPHTFDDVNIVLPEERI